MSIQAVKAVEIGDGIAQASQRGSVAHDAIALDGDFAHYRWNRNKRFRLLIPLE